MAESTQVENVCFSEEELRVYHSGKSRQKAKIKTHLRTCPRCKKVIHQMSMPKHHVTPSLNVFERQVRRSREQQRQQQRNRTSSLY